MRGTAKTALAIVVVLGVLIPEVCRAGFDSEQLREATELNVRGNMLFIQGRYADAEDALRRALKLSEDVLGPEHRDIAPSLNNLAAVYWTEGRYSDAEIMYKRVLAINEKSVPLDDPNLATTLDNLGLVYSDEGRYSEAEPLHERALAIYEKALGPDHPEVATCLVNLSAVYRAQGRYGDAETLLKRALAIREKVGESLGATDINNLAEVYQDEGLYVDAERLLKRALKIRENELGPDHADVAQSLNNIAELYREEGRYREAEAMQRRALEVRRKALGPDHIAVARSLNNLALILWAEGHYGDAHPLLRQALSINEKVFGSEHPSIATNLNNLAEFYSEERRYADAEPLLKRALAINEKALGSDNPVTANTLNNLAEIYLHEGRQIDAEPLLKRALTINEKTLGPAHPVIATNLNSLADIFRHEGRDIDAESLLERALAINEKALGAEHPAVAVILSNMAALYKDSGRYAQAVESLQRGMAIDEKILGTDHPNIVRDLNGLAGILLAQRKYSPARANFERARNLILKIQKDNQGLDDRSLANFVNGLKEALPDYLSLLADIASTPNLDPTLVPADAKDLAFVVADQIRSTATQLALARAAMRAATGIPATTDLARRMQDLGYERAAVEQQLDAEHAKSPSEQNSDRLRNLLNIFQNVQSQLVLLTQQLDQLSPQWREVSSPEPISAVEAKKLLRSGEALVGYFSLPDRVLIWVVRPNLPVEYRDLPIQRSDLAARVGKLLASTEVEPSSHAVKPFDVADAHWLYQNLLAPIKEQLSGVNHLILVPDDVLLRVPFAALVTSTEDQPYKNLLKDYELGQRQADEVVLRQDYPKIAWLVKEGFSTSVLPSATSLRTLRVSRGSRRTLPGEPFLGIGDPLLEGDCGERGGAMLRIKGAEEEMLSSIRLLPRLCDSARELRAEAEVFGADASTSLFLGANASKPIVMHLNLGRLGAARVVAFSTHALTVGALDGLKEPALVLTPPEMMTAEDNGLLELSDILRLKLIGNEWLILSACNTASPDESGEGLSGLARAFFYAGATSLLVSRWSVEEAASAGLMIEMFPASESGANSHADQLQMAMRRLIGANRRENPAYFAHPFAWASFFIVGEGGLLATALDVERACHELGPCLQVDSIICELQAWQSSPLSSKCQRDGALNVFVTNNCGREVYCRICSTATDSDSDLKSTGECVNLSLAHTTKERVVFLEHARGTIYQCQPPSPDFYRCFPSDLRCDKDKCPDPTTEKCTTVW